MDSRKQIQQESWSSMVLGFPPYVRISTSTGPSSDTHGFEPSKQSLVAWSCHRVPKMYGHRWLFPVQVSHSAMARLILWAKYGCIPDGFQVPCIYMRYPAHKHRNAIKTTTTRKSRFTISSTLFAILYFIFFPCAGTFHASEL